MKTPNDSLISAPLSVSGTWVSGPIWVNQAVVFGLQLYFENGITLVPTDVLIIRARHDRPYVANINAKLIIEE